MSDILKNRKDAKFIKDLEKKLNDKGYELVSYTPARVKGSHGTVTVKNPETQQVVESTYSSKTTSRAVKNLVAQIVKLFSGRGRRGQGEFKLSSDGPQREEWFGVLKVGKRMYSLAIQAFDDVMDDRQERRINEILSEMKNWFQENKPNSIKYMPNKYTLAQYIRKRRDIKREVRSEISFYRKVY